MLCATCIFGALRHNAWSFHACGGFWSLSSASSFGIYPCGAVCYSRSCIIPIHDHRCRQPREASVRGNKWHSIDNTKRLSLAIRGKNPTQILSNSPGHCHTLPLSSIPTFCPFYIISSHHTPPYHNRTSHTCKDAQNARTPQRVSKKFGPLHHITATSFL